MVGRVQAFCRRTECACGGFESYGIRVLRFSRHAARVVRVGFVIWFTWRWLGPQRSEACRLHAGVRPGRAADDAGSEPVRKNAPARLAVETGRGDTGGRLSARRPADPVRTVAEHSLRQPKFN